MPGKARDMHVEELREAKAAAARASRASKSRKEEKVRERRLADKARDLRIAELRDRKAPCAPRAPHAAVPSRAPRTSAPSKDKQWQKQLARAPALLDRLREGRAALDAIVAKVRVQSQFSAPTSA
jgi:hypothetical protein